MTVKSASVKSGLHGDVPMKRQFDCQHLSWQSHLIIRSTSSNHGDSNKQGILIRVALPNRTTVM